MADNKYGRIFTENDVQKILDFVNGEDEDNLTDVLDGMDAEGVRFKWEADEPVFVLRARDKTAEGAVRYYRDHQRPNAPANHLDGAEKSVNAFRDYRQNHPEMMKDPD